MPIPDFQRLFLPLVALGADGKEHAVKDAIEAMATEFKVTPAERAEMLPSGKAPRFKNRVAWAIFHLRRANLLETPRRGYYLITARGREVLAGKPDKINLKFLDQFPEHAAMHKRETAGEVEASSSAVADEITPEEAIEAAFQRSKEALAAELLDTMKKASAALFEKLVVDLIVKMGYGGSRHDAGQAIGGTGDGGVDGIIKEDRLGLDVIYLQAKKWDSTVGRPEIQKFAGALQGHHAKKGIFLTTGTFSKDARSYVSSIDIKISLIDGDELTGLMIDHDVGVSKTATYELKKVDADYFDEDDS